MKRVAEKAEKRARGAGARVARRAGLNGELGARAGPVEAHAAREHLVACAAHERCFDAFREIDARAVHEHEAGGRDCERRQHAMCFTINSNGDGVALLSVRVSGLVYSNIIV